MGRRPGLRDLSVGQFVRRIYEEGVTRGHRFVFFLGAGCSISSGIPGTGSIVRDHWLKLLPRYLADEDICRLPSGEPDLTTMAKNQFPHYDPDSPGSIYGDLIGELFRSPKDQQEEIERLCGLGVPGYGYAVLAKLMTEATGNFNCVLTTNFDDLIQDSLFLFSEQRPLVIHHESLMGFSRATQSRPLIVKVHGDQRLQPLNSTADIERLSQPVSEEICDLVKNAGLIFVGYGGNDEGIAEAFAALPPSKPDYGIYWVNQNPPGKALKVFLESRNAAWIKLRDFDELMLSIQNKFNLDHPDREKFNAVFENYENKFEELSKKIMEDNAGVGGDEDLSRATANVVAKYSDIWHEILRIDILRKSDSDKATEEWEALLAKYPSNVNVLGNYALFLKDVHSNMDGAESLYKRALEADPKHANTLGNYANFLRTVRRNMDGAEALYKRALEADPKHANTLGNYALFLKDIRDDRDGAETLYKRALEADPKDADTLGNYANFLTTVRNNMDSAESLYKRALEADPKHANNLGNYAVFLKDIRGDIDGAEALYKQALEADPRHANTLGNYALFLENVRGDRDGAEALYKRALEANPKDANILGNYALFLENVRGDIDGAEALYKRALEADPNHTNTLSNYAVFLHSIRNDRDRAESFYKRALETNPNHANTLGNYAGMLLELGRKTEGELYLEKSFALLSDKSPLGLDVELWYYQFANGSAEKRKESLDYLKKLVKNGKRSPDWDMSRNAEQGIRDNHPDKTWLLLLAEVIADKAPLGALDNWKKWADSPRNPDKK